MERKGDRKNAFLVHRGFPSDSLPQELVDRRLGPGLGVDGFHDHGAIEGQLRIRLVSKAGLVGLVSNFGYYVTTGHLPPLTTVPWGRGSRRATVQ